MKGMKLDAVPEYLSNMKVNLNFDAAAFEGVIRQDESTQNLVLDSQGQVFFKRQLELIKSETFDYEYHELKADKFLPVDTEGDLGVETITYRKFSKRGYAKIISDFATDIPRVDVLGEEVTVNIKTVAAAYGYNIFEIARAQRANFNLQSKRAETATEAIVQRLDRAAWFGSAEDNLQGFFDYPGILEYIVPNGAASATEFSTKTSAEILLDLNSLVRLVKTTTRGKRVVNQVLMPIDQFELISEKQNSTASDVTVLEFFKKTHPEVSIDWLDELKEAGTGGADMMMGYVKNSRNVAQYRPVPMMTMPQEYKNMEYVVTQISRTGGVVVYYPQSVVKASGI